MFSSAEKVPVGIGVSNIKTITTRIECIFTFNPVAHFFQGGDVIDREQPVGAVTGFGKVDLNVSKDIQII